MKLEWARWLIPAFLLSLAGTVQAASWTENLSSQSSGITKIIIFAGPGDLRVEALPGLTKVSADLAISYPGSLSSAEKHVEQKMDRYLKRDGKKLTLKAGYLRNVKRRDRKAQIDMVVKVPANLFLDIRDTSGDIDITGLEKGGRVLDGVGDISVSNSSGPLTLSDGSGDVRVFETSGKLRINDASDDLEVRNHKGELVINDKRGNMNAIGVRGGVRISDSSGNIDLEDIDGKVKITNRSGDILLTSINGNVELKDGGGDIRIDGVRGDLYVKTDKSGKVDIDGVSGEVKGVAE